LQALGAQAAEELRTDAALAADAVQAIITQGFIAAQNSYNAKE
jgi:hypothetical protein